jgi:hypothetical protein
MANCCRKARFLRANWWAANEEREEPEQVKQERDHRAGIVARSWPTDQQPVQRFEVVAKGEEQVSDKGLVTRRSADT